MDHLEKAEELIKQKHGLDPYAQVHALIDIAESLRKIAEHLFWLSERGE
jgi:hypothetical protein